MSTTKKKYPKFHPLSDIELVKYGKKLKLNNSFNVYAIDEIPNKIKPNEMGIINYKSRLQGGTHWVAYYNSDKNEDVIYIDSFGTPPPAIIEKFLNTSYKDIQYNMAEIQDSKSIMCGYYCLYFLDKLQDGFELSEIISQFNILNRASNEKLIRLFAKNLMNKNK